MELREHLRSTAIKSRGDIAHEKKRELYRVRDMIINGLEEQAKKGIFYVFYVQNELFADMSSSQHNILVCMRWLRLFSDLDVHIERTDANAHGYTSYKITISWK